jgi:hypothetical protein
MLGNVQPGRWESLALLAIVAGSLSAYGCSGGASGCDGPPGLYADAQCSVIAEGVQRYVPRFTLWADGADKQRYVSLPNGAQIDTSDPDNWVYPVGTVLYKTFWMDGVRLETRTLKKIGAGTGPSAWEMRAWAWNAAQDHVTDVTSDDGCPDCGALRTNVLGTDHDIPDGALCRQCHSGTADVVNGFSAIQLNHPDASVTLGDLVAANRLSHPSALVENAQIPGDETARAALGYLHANCGHCHRATLVGGVPSCKTPACLSGLLLWLPVGTKTETDTTFYQTAVNRHAIYSAFAPEATCRVSAGHPDVSVLVRRMSTREAQQKMPRIATEKIDQAGVDTVTNYVGALPPGPLECPL